MRTIKEVKKEIIEWEKAIPLFRQVDSYLPIVKIQALKAEINQIRNKI